ARLASRADILRQRWMAVIMARKKSSAQRGARVVKRGFAPANAIRRDEIVEEVVENLRPWKNHKSRESVTAAVNQQLDVLVELAPSLAKLSDGRRYRDLQKSPQTHLATSKPLIAFTWNDVAPPAPWVWYIANVPGDNVDVRVENRLPRRFSAVHPNIKSIRFKLILEDIFDL